MNLGERIEKLEKQLGEYDGKLRKLDELMGSATPQLRQECLHEVETLHVQSDKARARLHLLKLKKAQSWEEETFGSAVLEIFDELGEKLDSLFIRVNKADNVH